MTHWVSVTIAAKLFYKSCEDNRGKDRVDQCEHPTPGQEL